MQEAIVPEVRRLSQMAQLGKLFKISEQHVCSLAELDQAEFGH